MVVDKIGCLACGRAIEIYPPDSQHTVPLRKKDRLTDSIEMNVICKCGQENKIYWYEK